MAIRWCWSRNAASTAACCRTRSTCSTCITNMWTSCMSIRCWRISTASRSKRRADPLAAACVCKETMMTRKTTRRTFSASALAAAAALGMPRAARAQAYPTRPVRLILPFGAGGVADATSRLAADKLGDILKQRFVVENMPGPGGINAARAMITAQPDGYTLRLITNGTAISQAIYKQFPFDLVKDLAPISALGNFELVFATGADSPYKTMADLLKAAREQPGKLNVGTIAVGSTQHLGAELLRSLAK